MVRAAILLLALWLGAGSLPASAQPDAASADLVSSWLLVAAERDVASGEPRRVPGARGLLVLDRAGYVFELFTTPSGDAGNEPRDDPRRIFADNGGFWGRYEALPAERRIRFEAEDGVSPNVQGLAFSRSYELGGDRLIVTSTRSEPQAQADVRLTWQRVPTVEHLSPAYRELVGFWRHVEERRVQLGTGEVELARERAPSVIVYTPGGFVGVHFPTLGRKPFAGEDPTDAEAQALRNYLGYYGALGVYPREVFHNILGGVSPSAGTDLAARRKGRRRRARRDARELEPERHRGDDRAPAAPERRRRTAAAHAVMRAELRDRRRGESSRCVAST